MATTNELATGLLPHVKQEAVAGLLMQSATITGPVRTSVPLPGDVARSEAKGPVERVITAAQSTADPDALALLAKDKRITVMRVVAANDHTPADSILQLHVAAHERDDRELFDTTVRKLPIDVVLAHRGSSKLWNQETSRKVGSAAIAAGSVAELVSALGCDDLDIVGLALNAAYDGVAVLGFDEACAHVNDAQYASAIGYVLNHSRTPIDERVVARYLDPAVRDSGRAARGTTRKQQITDAAVELLLDADLDRTERIWLANLWPSDGIIERVFDDYAGVTAQWVLTPLLLVHRDRVSSACLHRVLRPVLADAEAAAGLAELALGANTQLDSDVQVGFATAGSADLRQKWLAGTCTSKPRDGDVTLLWNGAGTADPKLVEALREHLTRWAVASAICTQVPWGDELIDVIGAPMLRQAHHGYAARYLADRLGRLFGDDVTLWQVALGMAADWEGSVTALAEVAYLTLGREAPWTTPAPAAGTDDVGQLSLL